jgi:hypothetical protein
LVDPHDRHSHRRNPKDPHAPTAEQVEQKEVEEVELEVEKTPQEKDKTSSGKMGNAAVAMALATGTPPPTDTGNTSRAAQLSTRTEDKEKEASTLEFGGPPEPPPERPFEITDLTASWRPRVRQQRKIKQRGQTERTELSEDATFNEFLRRCQEVKPFPINMASTTIDPLIQPTPHIFRGLLTTWAQAATQAFTDNSQNEKLRGCILNPPSNLQDFRNGNPIHGAIRLAALSSLGLATRSQSTTSATIAHITFRLELLSRAHEIQSNATATDPANVKKTDTAASQFRALRPTAQTGHVVIPDTLQPSPDLMETILQLVRPPIFEEFVPRFPAPTPPSNNDPLGIDAILAQHIGGKPSHQDDVVVIVQSASERFAVNIAALARSLGALVAAIADICELWSSGAPNESLLQVLQDHDKTVASHLHTLIEITRAGLNRSVPPKGLHNGYTRVAKRMHETTIRTLSTISDIITTILPEPSKPREADKAANYDIIQETIDQCLVAADALSLQDWKRAAIAAMQVAEDGLSRRNGLLYLSGVLTLLEVHRAQGDVESDNEFRLRAGASLIQMSQLEGVRILAHWDD